MKILAFLGSLRKGSYNGMALRAAIELAPADMHIEVAEIGDLPLYNQDVEDAGIPQSVQRLKQQVKDADGLLFATPEYNYSVPGVLKNAIDWISRPPKENPFNGKPCAIMSASTGLLGGSRAQYHLRQTCVFVNLLPMNKPEVMISKAQEKFNADGTLADEATRKILTVFMQSLMTWAEQIGRAE
ncbi:MAG: NAD(P)H-dependent oxidoreductase [Bacteroidota bacterium]|nr:NAD(P)H-dependent oxidoreductase [Bacteroidota bacterium]MDP4232287.1 NAD(P)H-dependent oxidoreductase [Bacteroidota bacterium]MDP4241426.1 NAD(P)H-dependent oxidoreductase [Bacteroidota bacterium]MDP4286750.1 NAD(P)H-dependent oxidoreductase [Bacteroidota bacterium]